MLAKYRIADLTSPLVVPAPMFAEFGTYPMSARKT